MIRLNARELRTIVPDKKKIEKLKKNPIFIILDNVLDTYNVGALFRLADAAAAQKIYLCGETETPPNPRIKKASVNTWQWVEWEHKNNALQAINDLRKTVKNITICALEQHKKSVPLKNFSPKFPIALIVGNETFGISEKILKQADIIVELPMYGINNSLNVMVSCGIVLYKVTEYLNE